jgi:putative transposase
LTGSIKVFSNAVQLPRLGRLRLHEHGFLPMSGKMLSATVSGQAGRWFVSLQMESEQEQPRAGAKSAIGVDLGIKTLATLSDGTTFTNPRALKQVQKRLRRLERHKSRRKKGGANRKKTCRKLAKQHARVANIRQDAAQKFTTSLCKNHALVAIEDLPVAGMLKNHCLAQAVADSNFGEIRRQLEYKSRFYGVYLVTIDRWYASSKTCSCCGWVNKKQTLDDRVFVCLDCGYVADRDYNAAKNILAEALRSTASSVGSYASGESSAGLHVGASETALVERGTNLHLGMS